MEHQGPRAPGEVPVQGGAELAQMTSGPTTGTTTRPRVKRIQRSQGELKQSQKRSWTWLSPKSITASPAGCHATSKPRSITSSRIVRNLPFIINQHCRKDVSLNEIAMSLDIKAKKLEQWVKRFVTKTKPKFETFKEKNEEKIRNDSLIVEHLDLYFSSQTGR
jgi:hypothetical protein